MLSTLPLLMVLATSPGWRDEVLSSRPEVRSQALAHLHARGRSGLYALQGVVESAHTADERVRAVRALGELGDPEAEWELRLQLKQSSPQVVAAAVRAARRLELPGLARAVTEKVGDPNPEVCAALGEAAAIYPAILDAARSALEGAGPRQLVGLRILQAAHLTVPESTARRLASSSIAEVRLAAAESLASTDADEAATLMADLLPTPLAGQAATALGRLGTPRALALLEEQVKRSRGDAGILLALAGSSAGEKLLLKRRSGLPAGSRLVAAIDTAIEAQPRTPELLMELLADPDEQIANAAAANLARHPAGRAALTSCLERLKPQAPHCAAGLAASPAAAAEVGRSLESLEPGVRAAMVAGLGAAEALPQMGTLARMIADPSPEVRVALAIAAGHLRGQGLEILQALAHDNQASVRTAAVAQLVSLLPTERLAALAGEAIGDPAIRGPLLEAVDRLPTHASIRLLRASLLDSNGSERRQALLALARIHDPEAVNALMDSAASDADPALRELAYTMLASQ